MNYTITEEYWFPHEGAMNVGFTAAQVFSSRGEVAHNPYPPNTLYWYSFNLGARQFLTSGF